VKPGDNSYRQVHVFPRTLRLSLSPNNNSRWSTGAESRTIYCPRCMKILRPVQNYVKIAAFMTVYTSTTKASINNLSSLLPERISTVNFISLPTFVAYLLSAHSNLTWHNLATSRGRSPDHVTVPLKKVLTL